jgi:glycosyltransferase involved in cell wall biosynthesis
MRILALTRYAPLGPSSRVRFYQYYPYLQQHGVEIQTAPLLDDEYIRRLYSKKRTTPISIIAAYLQRLYWLTHSSSFDLLWIEKELLPWLPAWAESVLHGLGVPYIVDFDDAIFHRYDMNTNVLTRNILGKKISAVIRNATSVVAGNNYLVDYARQAGARKVEYLPSVVDLERYSLKQKEKTEFRIGWIGSPITVPFLGLISVALEQISKNIDARLVLIGSGDNDPLPGIRKEIIPWREESQVNNIQSFDVGIMPLPDAPFERGKCGYKLIQYMACGLPVIGSPVGVNSKIIEHGKTGFLASSNAEWIAALETLYKNPDLRSEFGKAGRKKVEQEYSLQVSAPRLLEILTAPVSNQ